MSSRNAAFFLATLSNEGREMSSPNATGIPADLRKIHLIAVCGTGMGALACMLKQSGYEVTGTDQQVYPPISEFLTDHGIRINIGYSPENLSHRPDLVVVGNAVSKENPEVRAMQQMGLPYCSMPQAINRFAAAGKRQIVVTGTHGKTTTASFLAWLLACAGQDPSFLIGGIVTNFESNFRVGRGPWIVLEGDEYDTAFFDKGPKFLHYNPAVAVLTGVEFDHADIFRDLEHVKQAFGTLLAKLDPQAILYAFDQDVNIAAIIDRAQCPVMRYGHEPASAWQLGEIRIEPPLTRFQVLHHGALESEYRTLMIGEHNLRNLLAGIAVGQHLGLDHGAVVQAVSSFRGARRRQEVRGSKRGVIVIDDFAHHPTAVRETIRALKAFYKNNRLVAVFEPRTNSSRRNVFQSTYQSSFDDADLVCIRQAPMLEKIPEDQRFSSEKLAQDLRKRGKQAYCFADTDEIVRYLVREARPRDVILIMSNGAFDNIHGKLLQQL
jgi:UDP-N-acetylmuramate: L-alanyl-gamma-D-glutamyl-meso-diaminopimelate ligase